MVIGIIAIGCRYVRTAQRNTALIVLTGRIAVGRPLIAAAQTIERPSRMQFALSHLRREERHRASQSGCISMRPPQRATRPANIADADK